MVKIIETNISLVNMNVIADHQSRIIEVNSWNDYVKEFVNNISVDRNSYIGELIGCTVPRKCRIENLESDNVHLMCDIFKWDNTRTKKLAYLIKE